MSIIKKKTLGQNFLTSKAVVSSIINASNISQDETIIEIGPGEGYLTEDILKNSRDLVIVEKDHRLIPILSEKFKTDLDQGHLKIIEGDILDTEIGNILSPTKPYKVIANIPYYITGQIIRKFLEEKVKPTSMTLLVQKEVAERIIARDGKESLLSLSVKVFGTPSIVRKVSRGSFNPAPNVDSAVIYIQDITNEKLKGLDPELFFKVIHAGFEHKRKQLLPNLSNVFTKDITTKTLEKLNINPKVRAEDLKLDDWINICLELKENEKSFS